MLRWLQGTRRARPSHRLHAETAKSGQTEAAGNLRHLGLSELFPLLDRVLHSG